jgi:hypothetical protein
MLPTRFALLFLVPALASSCGDHCSDGHRDAECPPVGMNMVPEAIFDDCTVEPPSYDEAFLALLDAQAREMVDEANAPAVISPREGEAVSLAAGPPTLRWSERGATTIVPGGAAKGVKRHGCIVSGNVFWLRLRIGSAEPVHILNLDAAWTVDATTWSKLMAAQGQTVTLEIIRAYLNQNRLLEGPFRAPSPRTFQIGP